MTRVELYSLAGREDAETVAVWEDGEWVEGADAVDGVYPDGPPGTADGVREQAAGPGLFASTEPASPPPDPTADKSWVPYEGELGGEGWRSLDDGRVVYDDEPPGERVSPEDVANAILEDSGVSTDAVAGDRDGEVKMSEADQDRLRDAVEDAFGGGGEEAYKLASMWKHSSYQDTAQTREKAMMEAFGLDGEPRNGDLDGDDPDPDLVAAVAVMGEVSRELLRGSDADNGDGTVTLHRGLGDRSGQRLDVQYLEALATGEDTFVLEENPASNYSMTKNVADSWGRKTASVTDTVPIDEVLAATDAVADVEGSESEVTVEGGTRELDASEVDLRADGGAAALEGSTDYEDLETPYVVATDALTGDVPLTPEAVAGVQQLADQIRQSDADFADELADDINRHVEAARDHEPGDDLLAAVREHLPDDERFATVQRAVMAADPSLANELVRIANDEGRGAAFEAVEEEFGRTAESGRLAQAVRELNQRQGWTIPVPLPGEPTVDQKAAEPIPVADDPDSVDWIARSRDDRGPPPDSTADKSWIPYTGPEGGEGWKDADSGEVRYQQDPPGETLTSNPADEPLSEGDRVLLRYDGEVHAGEVVAETPRDVRVRDDRNLWTLDKDEKDQYGGDMEVLNAGQPESDQKDPATMDIDDADDLEYVLGEADNDNDPDSFIAERILDAAETLGTEEIYEAVEASDQSARIATYSLKQAAESETDDGTPVSAEPTREEHSEHRDRLKEQHGREALEQSATVAAGWEGAMYRDPRTSPLISMAMENTGNENLPEYSGSDRAAEDAPDEELETMEDISDFTTETLREAFGDEVTMFRGFSKNPHMGTPSTGTDIVEQMEDAVESGEDVEIEHRPAESWSLNPETASLYADTSGAVVKSEISVEDVAMSSSAGTIDYAEDDTVVEHEGAETYDPDDVIIKDNMETKKARFVMNLMAAEGARK